MTKWDDHTKVTVMGVTLLARDLEILRLIADEDLTNKAIASRMGVAVKTIEKVLGTQETSYSIYNKIKVRTRYEAAMWYQKWKSGQYLKRDPFEESERLILNQEKRFYWMAIWWKIRFSSMGVRVFMSDFQQPFREVSIRSFNEWMLYRIKREPCFEIIYNVERKRIELVHIFRGIPSHGAALPYRERLDRTSLLAQTHAVVQWGYPDGFFPQNAPKLE
jgi:hypothetical protein